MNPAVCFALGFISGIVATCGFFHVLGCLASWVVARADGSARDRE